MTASSRPTWGFSFPSEKRLRRLHTRAFRNPHLRRVSEYVYLGAAAPCFIISLHKVGSESGLFFDGHDKDLHTCTPG